MKTIYQYSILALIILTTVLTSCKKPKPNLTPVEPEVEVTPKKLLEVTGMMKLYTNGVLPETDSYLWVNKKYDQSGNLMLLNKWNLTNTFEKWRGSNHITTYEYEDGKMVESERRDADRITYTYSGNDTLEIVQYSRDGIALIKKYKYGSNGMPESITIQDKNNITAWVDKYAYNSKKQIITKDRIFPPPALVQQIQYEYNSQGDHTAAYGFYASTNERKLQSEHKYTYDSKGRIIDNIRDWGKGVYLKWTKTYNSDGEITQEEASTGPTMDGPFVKVGLVKYEYKYFEK